MHSPGGNDKKFGHVLLSSDREKKDDKHPFIWKVGEPGLKKLRCTFRSQHGERRPSPVATFQGVLSHQHFLLQWKGCRAPVNRSTPNTFVEWNNKLMYEFLFSLFPMFLGLTTRDFSLVFLFVNFRESDYSCNFLGRIFKGQGNRRPWEVLSLPWQRREFYCKRILLQVRVGCFCFQECNDTVIADTFVCCIFVLWQFLRVKYLRGIGWF